MKPNQKTMVVLEKDVDALEEIRVYYGLNARNEALRFALRHVLREVQEKNNTKPNKKYRSFDFERFLGVFANAPFFKPMYS